MEINERPRADLERFTMLQAGLDLLDQGMTVFDADLRLVAWNAPFLRLLGFPAELAFVGATFESFIRHNAKMGEYGPGDADSQVRARVATAAGFAPHTTERVRPNGQVLRLRGEPLPDKGFITLYTDITAQRRIEALIQQQNAQLENRVLLRTAELQNANTRLSLANDENERIAAALQRSESRLRLINDNMPFLIGYVDKDKHYQYANKGYSDWFGVPIDAVVGSYLPDLIGAELYAQLKGYIEQALAGKQLTYEYQMQRDGQTVYARSTLVPEISPDNETLGFFTFSQNMTEQKQMQAALVQAQKMESLGQLTGGLAHDFNNLLTVIIGTLVGLQEHPLHAAELNKFVAPALQSARRGAQLIKRLLTFSRQHPLEPAAVDVAQMIGDMGTLIRRSLPDAITVSTDFPVVAIECMVDPAQFESALLNFIMNARDAMPQGGRLHISARAVDLSAEACAFAVPPGAYAMIEVADSGCGMDAATLARAYEPFFTTKRFGRGSGLGLSMAYGLVKQSGGGILLQSQPGQGTTVRLVLPLTHGDAKAPCPPSDTALLHARELVLLVEDEPDVRRVVRQQLTDLGHPVIEAENGVQALQMVTQVAAIAIVLCDVVMPGDISGAQLARQVTASHPQMRILLMSGYNDDAAEAGPGDPPLLTKPFTRQDLARALLLTGKGTL
ncbi:hybrid sensor histidine kinase/response regulator [Massilia eurypsychrophila]|uniref:histidine kinase n=1 Tax=Massilia eurypsychrophila TaxID=1485217 RepID=A0A2G8TIU5_9BURK|nr:PAS-domain containing protein [Massilia eurypsychrophila]PIL45960.1 hybrid sensor histidine kinase/response regulator [Massilia eurypsychrophila]